MTPPTVAVLGGGIAGLAAAWELTGRLPGGARVVVVEGGASLGGKLRTAEFAGRPVDLGPDAFITRRGEAVQLCEELGLRDDLVTPGSSGAYVFARGRLRRLPDGLVLGIPTRIRPLAASGICSWSGVARAALDLLAPRIGRRPSASELVDEPVGPLVRRRLGTQVHERLSDPLVGGINAGPTDSMSAAAVFPQLLEASRRGGSLMRALRSPDDRDSGHPSGPVFMSVRGGMQRLAETLARALQERGVEIRLGSRAVDLRSLIARGPQRWSISLARDTLDADGVVVALPAPEASRVVGGIDPRIAELLGAVPYASVALATLRFRAGAVGTTLDGTGFLVPVAERRLITACTWLSTKWPELSRPDDVLLRVSVGRFGDDRQERMSDHEIVSGSVEDLDEILGVREFPLDTDVARWPRAFPQYLVGHPSRVAEIEQRRDRTSTACVLRRSLPRRWDPRMHRERPEGGRDRGGKPRPRARPEMNERQATTRSGDPGAAGAPVNEATPDGAREDRAPEARRRPVLRLSRSGSGVGRLRPPDRVTRWGRIVLPSLLAGVALTLSIPPFGFWVIAFPGAAILWWRLGGLRWRQRVGVGLLAGLGQFVVSLWWALSFNVYGGIVLMIVQSLWPALVCAFVPRHRGRALVLTGGMVLVEALRSIWPFGGLPMGGIALGQAGGPLADASRLGGPLLLVAMVWLAGCGLGLLAVALVDGSRAIASSRAPARPPASGGTRPYLAGAAGAILAFAAVGVVAGLGSAASDGGHAVATLRVASVQGGGVRGLRKAEVSPAAVYAAQVEATTEIPELDAGRPPALILWPEDVVSLDDLIDTDPVKAALSSIARRYDATFVVGVTETVSQTGYRNEIVAFSPDGRIVARFEKVHRVPFGEYVPYRGFFKHLADLSAVPLDAIPGHGDGLLRTPAARLGTLVSYEVFFAQRGWVATRAGAQLLVVPTNTSSYATSQVPCQEVAAARIQALSEGRDLVQAAPTGFSSIIDNTGAVLERSSLGKRQVLVRDVKLRTGLTVYGKFGDLPVLVAAGVLVLAGWLAALTNSETPESVRRERRDASGGS